MNGRGPWHNNSSVPAGGLTRLGLSLLDLIERIAAEGQEMPRDARLAKALGASAAGINRALHALADNGHIRVEAKGRTIGTRRRVTVVRSGATTAPIDAIAKPDLAAERRAILPHLVMPGPPVREELRVVRDRCPFCNLPPQHGACRHGWDGQTTRAQRRDAAIMAQWAA
ncbi:MAG: hypothetical protein ACK4PC_03500 [Sphingopyxis sp.]